jgi:outer membrane protein, multidrug efflux system
MKRWLTLTLGAGLAACSLAPELPDPKVTIPPAYKETSAQISGDWQLAKPADDVERGAWWAVFRDPALDVLLVRATAENQSLQAALARVEQTRAQVRVAKSAQRPRLDFGAGGARVQPSSVPPQPGSVGTDSEVAERYTTLNARIAASYELDLFGRVRDTLQAARADLAAERALFASLVLSLQSDVAETYFLVRAADEELAILHATVKLREEGVRLLQRRADAGDISEFDLKRETADLEAARADVHALERIRAQYEHALAVLCGQVPATFALVPLKVTRNLPEIPAGVPSTLLERRPDIAAAQRRMVAANARIGVAKAAFYPILNLTADFGVESSSLGDLFKWSARTWALGPVAGALLSLPIFDGGRNDANLAASEASLDAEIARYRQTVLTAFGEVEDGLSGLRTLAAQASALQAAITAADEVYRIAEVRYAAGATGYLDVLDARRTQVRVKRLAAQVYGTRAVTTVGLIRALGGGW